MVALIILQLSDYPMRALTKPVQTILRKTLNDCPGHVLELFLEHCIQAMTNDMAKGRSSNPLV